MRETRTLANCFSRGEKSDIRQIKENSSNKLLLNRETKSLNWFWRFKYIFIVLYSTLKTITNGRSWFHININHALTTDKIPIFLNSSDRSGLSKRKTSILKERYSVNRPRYSRTKNPNENFSINRDYIDQKMCCLHNFFWLEWNLLIQTLTINKK